MSDTPAVSERLDAIRDRLAKATPGPWETVPTTGNAVVSPDGDGYWTDVADNIGTEEDADLIANAPADLAWLIERLEDAEAVFDRIRAAASDTSERSSVVLACVRELINEHKHPWIKETPDGP